MKITIFANTVYTNTLTGGDKIFVECAKKWIAWGHEVTIVTNRAGKNYCLQNGIGIKYIVLWKNSWADAFGVYISMMMKAITTMIYSLISPPKETDIIFASSLFFPDTFSALITKLKFPNSNLVIASYLYSSKKWGRDYSGGRLKGAFFYLNEIFAFWILGKYGNGLITASGFDREGISRLEGIPVQKILAIRGGVDTEFFSAIHPQTIEYDAVFVGRFHPQKCVDELIDVWHTLIKSRPQSKLALIGSGPLEATLKHLVELKNLQKNIFFLGQLDGVEKTKILKSARIFVSASRFDSGNIALDEALSCGIPGIIYDLPRLSYPSGVIKIPVDDQKAFSLAIVKLLANEPLRKQLGNKALSFALTLDWSKKAKQLLSFCADERS